MGQPLTGNSVESTYVGLLKTGSNAQLPSGSMESVSDGLGNDSALELGQTQGRLKGDYVELSNTTQTAAIIIDENVGDKVNYVGEQDFSAATVTGLPDTNTTYTIESVQDGSNIDVKLVGSDASVSTVQLNAGTNITLTQNVDGITIEAAGGSAGLVAGTGTNSMKSADSLTSNPSIAAGTDSIAIGNGAKAYGNQIAIGKVDNAFSGDTGTFVAIVPDSVDMAFRTNSVVIGPTCYPASGGTAIGNNARHTGGGHYNSVAIGNTINVTGDRDVAIGYNLNNPNADSPDKITIGSNNTNYAEKSIIIGTGNDNADSVRVNSILIGNSIKGAQYAIVIGNDSSNYASADSIQIGNGGHITNSNYGLNIGYANEIIGYQDNAVVIGQNNTLTSLAGAAIIGNGITAVRANTLHTNGLNVGTVGEYADNAAAVAAGLPNGQVYRTGDLLKIVHP